MAIQLVLLQRVEKLGNMGDLVSVKPGYARNFLLPQKKALRASKSNIAYFESQKKHLEAENDKQKAAAQKQAKSLSGLKVDLIRQASESGQLYGSVTSRDIAEQTTSTSGQTITRDMVDINQNYKLIGLFPIDIILHPEVKAEVTINIARSAEEAEMQAKTGKAMISDRRDALEDTQLASDMPDDDALEGVLEEGALEAEKERQVEAEEKATEEAEKVEERAVKKAEKEAAAKAVEAEVEAEAAAEAEKTEEKAGEDA